MGVISAPPAPPRPSPGPHILPTYHLLQQRGVAFSKKHAEVQDLWDVEQEVVVEDFSESRGRNEVILRNSKERMRDLPKHVRGRAIASLQETAIGAIGAGLASRRRSVHTKDVPKPRGLTWGNSHSP